MKQGLVIHVSDFNAWISDEDELWYTFSDCGTITSCKKRTLEEYEKVLEEKRKAFPALKSEERKVELDKDFESMQLLSNKKNEEEFFVKLESNKDKRKEAGKEVKAKKVLNLNELLKPAEGERYYGPGRGRGHGPGRVRGPGPRGGHSGIMGDYVPGPENKDQQQFPTLGSK